MADTETLIRDLKIVLENLFEQHESRIEKMMTATFARIGTGPNMRQSGPPSDIEGRPKSSKKALMKSATSRLQQRTMYGDDSVTLSHMMTTQGMQRHTQEQATESKLLALGLGARKKNVAISKAQPVVEVCGKIVSWPGFELLSSSLVLLCAVYLGFNTSTLAQSEHVIPYMIALSWIFNVLFTAELCVRFLGEGRFFFSRLNPNMGWNIFDLIIVTIQWISELSAPVFVSLGLSMDAQIIRLVRVARMVRVAKLLVVARQFAILRSMITRIMFSAKELLWALFLIFLLEYMFGVCLVQIVHTELRLKEVPEETKQKLLEFYPNLLKTIYVLYKSICGGLDWGDAADPLWDMGGPSILIYCFYIAFTVFCVLNILTGIFVDTANKMLNQNIDQQLIEHVSKQERQEQELTELFCAFLPEGETGIDFPTFERHLEDARVQLYLEKFGIDVKACSTRGLFMHLDTGGNGKIEVEEFARGLHHIQGPARSQQIWTIRQNQEVLANNQGVLRENLEVLANLISDIHVHLGCVSSVTSCSSLPVRIVPEDSRPNSKQ